MHLMGTSSPAPAKVGHAELAEHRDVPWQVIVWDDPVNLMSYVTFVFQKLFGFSRTRAETLMLQVHNDGRAMVSSGPLEKAEHDVFRLQEHGLWASLERQS